jgi:hypothetical protein
MWNYLFFVVKVMETEPEYYTSMENHVAGMIERNDIGWFPLHRAIILENNAKQADGMNHAFQEMAAAQASMQAPSPRLTNPPRVWLLLAALNTAAAHTGRPDSCS